MTVDREEIQRRFWPHKLTDTQKQEVNRIRIDAEGLAARIVAETPASREQGLALTQLEQAAMWAVAAIARNPPES